MWRPLVFVGALALASSVLRLTAMNPNSQYGDKFIHGVLAKEPKFPAPSPRLAPHARVAVKAEVEEGGEGGWGCAVVE